MPFGLTKAPAVFQLLLNNVRWDLVWDFIWCILMIFSYIHVRQVLQHRLENKLFMKGERHP